MKEDRKLSSLYFIYLYNYIIYYLRLGMGGAVQGLEGNFVLLTVSDDVMSFCDFFLYC